MTRFRLRTRQVVDDEPMAFPDERRFHALEREQDGAWTPVHEVEIYRHEPEYFDSRSYEHHAPRFRPTLLVDEEEGRLYVEREDGTLYVSTDGGATWALPRRREKHRVNTTRRKALVRHPIPELA